MISAIEKKAILYAKQSYSYLKPKFVYCLDNQVILITDTNIKWILGKPDILAKKYMQNKKIKIFGGVIKLNEAPHIQNDFGYSISVEYNEAINYHLCICNEKELSELDNENKIDMQNCIDNDHQNFTDNFSCENETLLLGFIEITDKKSAWYWYDQLGYGYMPDDKANFSAIINEYSVQVVKSKFYSLCGPCSPCYPDQCDLTLDGDTPAYNLPVDYYGDLKHLDIVEIKSDGKETK